MNWPINLMFDSILRNDVPSPNNNASMDLFKYYIDLVVKVNVIYFGVLGSLLTYLASANANNVKEVGYLLILPVLLSFFQTIGYINSLSLATTIYSAKMRYCFPSTYHRSLYKSNYQLFNPLKAVLALFSTVHILIIIATGVAWYLFPVLRFWKC